MVSRDLIGNALVLGLVLVASMAGCRKPALESPDAISIGEVAGEQVVPTLTTTAISNVAGGNATSGGMVLRDGGLPVTARGVCYARHASPSLADGFTTDSTGIGAFVSQLSGLMVDSTYYVRAYATNAVGTGYGDVLSFVAGNGLPVILTTAMTVTANSAQAGGQITSTGGSAISAKGICYATSQGPSLGNGTVVPASGGGLAFTVPLTGLVNGTFYYVRAFATNTTGTAYGAQVSFTAGAPLSAPAVTTVGVTDITPTTALADGSVDFPNGAAVTQHGFCYGTAPNPTLGDATLITGSGTGPFSGTLTDLSSGTIYYLRAFATNSAGTGYGSTVSFTTSQVPCPATVTDIDGNEYPVVQVGSRCWMTTNLRTTRYRDGSVIPNVVADAAWASLNTGAWCNYENNASNDVTYGKLYNWYAAMDPRGICPLGWHVPTDVEWGQLENALGMPASVLGNTGFRGAAQNVGGKMKAMTLWNSPNTGATNSSGISALPSGYRSFAGGFGGLGNSGYWWSASMEAMEYAFLRTLNSSDAGVGRYSEYKRAGDCVRCLRD